jgi:hypothetical protein
MKNIVYRRVLILFAILVVISLLAFFFIFGNDESGFGDKASNGLFSYIIVRLSFGLYYFTAFPNIIMLKLGLHQNGYDFIFGILAGSLFDAFLLDVVLISYRRYEAKNKSDIEHPNSEI